MLHPLIKRILSGSVAVSMLAAMSVTAFAASPKANGTWQIPMGKAPTVSQTADSTTQSLRDQINSLNSSILTLKKQNRDLLRQLADDLAVLRADPNSSTNTDYQQLISDLTNVRTEAAAAEKINYQPALKAARDFKGETLSTRLETVISLLEQKQQTLETIQTNLQAALSRAAFLAQGKTTTNADWLAFRTAAITKKQTIDTQNMQIRSGLASCRSLLSKIVATAAANKTVLASDQNAVLTFNTNLLNICSTLKIYDGSIAAAEKVYRSDVKSKNYTDALTQLDNIISIQKQRITAVETAQTGLQGLLNQLNALVSGSTSSAATAT